MFHHRFYQIYIDLDRQSSHLTVRYVFLNKPIISVTIHRVNFRPAVTFDQRWNQMPPRKWDAHQLVNTSHMSFSIKSRAQYDFDFFRPKLPSF